MLRTGPLKLLPQVGHEPVAQANGGNHLRLHTLVHPGQIDRAVRLPGVHHHARVQRAGLHPAHKEFGRGHRAGKAAHVMANVEHAREAHLQTGADVPAQIVPAGAVVARPGLCIALQARWTTARDGVHALTWRVLALRLVGGAGHQQRVQGAGAVHGHGGTKAGALRAVVHHGVFVVVVPAHIDAIVQHLFLEALLPPGNRRCAREVQVRTHAVPKLLHHRLA